jgi:hypothetical protein
LREQTDLVTESQGEGSRRFLSVSRKNA